MVNTEDFVKRLTILLDYYSLNASSFADKIGVQRSSLSHLLSGRNKPSLDFILKILEVFPEVDLYWILNGKGDFPKTIASEKQIETAAASPLKSPVANATLFSELQQPKNNPLEAKATEIQSKSASTEIETIVFFYKDGTFKEFKPS